MGRLDGKVAIVTGAARGQGEATARLFATHGARVVVADILADEGRTVAGDLGEAARFVHLDVTSEQAWATAVEEATEAFGGVDVLVNNAAILKMVPLVQTSLEDLMDILRVNVAGVFLGMKAVTRTMRSRGGGSIVNISSIDGLHGMPWVGAYVASKFAVRGITKTAAIEFAQWGIRVNSVHPGSIDTTMFHGENADLGAEEAFSPHVPLRRIGTPEEVAAVSLFLASDESSYCTGAEFVVDGGFTTGISIEAMLPRD